MRRVKEVPVHLRFRQRILTVPLLKRRKRNVRLALIGDHVRTVNSLRSHSVRRRQSTLPVNRNRMEDVVTRLAAPQANHSS